MAIIYKTGYTEDSGGLLVQNAVGAIAIEIDFYRPLSASVADNTDSFTFVSGDIGGGSGGFYTLDANGNFTNTSNGSGLTELRINGVISNPVDLNTAGADTVRLQFTSVLGGSFTIFDYPDNPAGSNNFLFKGVEISRLNITDDNGSRDMTLSMGSIIDPSGILSVTTYGDINNFEDTAAGGDTTPPVVTLDKYTETITVGDPWTPPVANATDDVDGDISGSVVRTGTIDHTTVGNNKTYTYNVTDAAGNAADPVTYTLNVVAAGTGSTVFLPIGQSNVIGWTAGGANDTNYTLGDYPIGTSGRVRQIGVDNTTIRNATNPLDHWDEPVGSAGLWKTFAEKLPENQIWVAAGKGGSSFDYPANTDPQTWTKGVRGGYYDKSVELLGLALAENPANTIGAVILWLGESAATHSRTQQEMYNDLVTLRNNYIADTAITVDTIWIVYGVRVDSAGLREKGQVIRDALQQFAATSPAIRYVDNMSYPMADTVHYTAAGYNQAGLDGYAAYVATTDTTKPVITLDKYNETITVGDPWTPPVATVTDNVDTGLTADRTGTIDHTTVGNGKTYTYNVTDAAGNAADPVTYTLNVVEASSGGGLTSGIAAISETYENQIILKEWVNLYDIPGINQGDILQIQNISEEPSEKLAVICQISSTRPASNSKDGRVIYPEKMRMASLIAMTSTTKGLWLRNLHNRPATIAVSK